MKEGRPKENILHDSAFLKQLKCISTSSDRKQIGGCLGIDVGRDVTFGSVGSAQHCDSGQFHRCAHVTHQLICFENVKFVICQLCPNENIKQYKKCHAEYLAQKILERICMQGYACQDIYFNIVMSD